MSKMNGLPATFSTLVLSLASSAVMALGLEKNPVSEKIEKDLDVARFNIDMLLVLKEKTKGQLTADEQSFLERVTADLQVKFVQVSQNQGAQT